MPWNVRIQEKVSKRLETFQASPRMLTLIVERREIFEARAGRIKARVTELSGNMEAETSSSGNPITPILLRKKADEPGVREGAQREQLNVDAEFMI